jgi:hypothetical protein
MMPFRYSQMGWLLSALLCLAACDESPKPEQSPQQSNEAAARVNEDLELLKDLGRAVAELEQRLLKSVSVQDGLVIVRDPLTAGFFTYVLPTTTPWIISCGVGLSVTFGSAVSGDGSNVGNDVEVRLALAPVNREACAVLAPRLGQRLKAMLQESH